MIKIKNSQVKPKNKMPAQQSKQTKKSMLEKLSEMEKLTKERFTKLLIKDLKEGLSKAKEISMFEEADFDRITNLIEHEKKRLELKNFKWAGMDKTFIFKISGKKDNSEIEINGNKTLRDLFERIEQEFDLDPGHLYEFHIGKYVFGTLCDEWQERFDGLDDYKIGFVLEAGGLNKKDSFRFTYDFGEEKELEIKIQDIKNGK
ncbi:plasmid pRiA4b ORF-3-like protein [archaeon BMS3Abin17]|nr:plasmid pRiA4b ORF-3-like protein [archaeon BMS3Abin17]HDZ60741.1 hypothetical protein [Candidatus Pacearchaeota archaeon]